MSVNIRAVKSSDEQEWRRMWEQYNAFYKRTIPEDVTKTTFASLLDDNVRMYGAVAVDGESLIGFANWFPHLSTSTIAESVYLNDLFVDETVRNKGAGRALIEHVYAHARTTLSAARVYWLTQHFNHRAQLLYTKVGTKSDFVHYFKDLSAETTK